MNRLVLRVASWIAPWENRADWLAEWRAELAHVASVDRAQAFGFCLGAFWDAWWLRRHTRRTHAPLLASPVHTLAVLGALAAIGAVCRPAPGLPREVVAIRSHGRPVLLMYEEYVSLTANPPAGFEAFAFYRTACHRAVATRSMDAVLRGHPLPDAPGGYATVDDPGPGAGFVIARLTNARQAPWWHISIPSPRGGRELLDCVPLNPGQRALAVLMIFGAAIIILPTVGRFSLGATERSLRLWFFFAAKTALALMASYFSVIAIAGRYAPVMVPQALIITFLLTVRWSFNDQRRRCPTCLRLLASPVSFGCLGHILLDWHGAEFICPDGHGLLQVSATPASPYAPEQWVRL